MRQNPPSAIPSETISLRSILKEKELWILISLVVLFFFRILFLGQTLYYRDLGLHFLPQKETFVYLIKHGQPPLWNPFDSESFWANASHTPLYPSNLFYLLFPIVRMFNWDIVLHVILCVSSAYLFVRILGIRPPSAFLAGVIYGFCGLGLSIIGALNQFLSMPEIPLMFASWHLFLIRRQKKYFVAAALFGFLQFMAGTPEVPVGIHAALLAWTFCYPYSQTSPLRRICLWLALVVFIFGLSSIQLLPMGDLAMHSPRGMGVRYSSFTEWSLSPKRLPEMVIPSFLGRVDALDYSDYWGAQLESGGEPLYLSIYCGSAVFALALLAGLRRKNDGAPIPLACRTHLLLMLLLPTFFALGANLPFFSFLHQYIPPLRIFRFPSKLLVYTTFPLSVLAAYSVDMYFKDREILPSKKILLFFWIFPALFLILLLFWMRSDHFSNSFQSFFFEKTPNAKIHQRLQGSFVHAFLISSVAAFLFQYRRIAFRRFLIWMVIALVATDLLMTGSHINPSAPDQFLTTAPQSAQIVRKEIADGRLYPAQNPGQFLIRASSNDAIWFVRWEIDQLIGYSAILFQIPIAFRKNISDMTPLDLKEHYQFIESLPWNRRLPFLSAGAVRLFVTDEKLDLPSFQLVMNLPNSGKAFYLYKNLAASPRTVFVNTWIFRSSRTGILQAMVSPKFDPTKHVVLEGPDSQLIHHDCAPAKLQVVEATSNSLQLTLQNSCDGYLVFSDPYYPGWRVKVDGKDAPIIKANAAHSSVFLSAGRHDVNRFYRPSSVLFGIAIFLLFAALLFIVQPQRWSGL